MCDVRNNSEEDSIFHSKFFASVPLDITRVEMSNGRLKKKPIIRSMRKQHAREISQDAL